MLDSEMHKAPFVCIFSKVHVEKLNHPSHLNDAHYSVVVFLQQAAGDLSSCIHGAAGGGAVRKGRGEGVSGVGGALFIHICKLNDFPERSLDLW